jgi:hypothetical protein
MALLSLLSITWLTLAAPQAPAPTSVVQPAAQDIRVVLFISAPKNLQKSLVQQIAIPVGQDVELVPMDEFQAAAKRARLHRAGSLKAAVLLARPLRLSHVVSVSVVQPRHKKGGRRHSEDHTFLEVFVGRLRPKREVLSVKRYYLPNHKVSPSTARVIVDRIKAQVQLPPVAPQKPREDDREEKHNATAPQAAPTAPQRPQTLPLGDQDDLDPLTQDMMAEQEAETDAAAAQAATNANHVLHMRGSLALTVVQRNAYLTAGVSGESPPCYCGTGTFANTFLGVHATADLFFREGLPGFGAITELTLYWPHSDVQTDAQARTITSFVTDFRLALAYQWRSSIGIELIPRVGWGLYDFPLSDGDFPGLSYSYPLLGLDLGFVFASDAWRLNVSVDYLATLSPGEDAVRLGQKTNGNGVQIGGGIAWDTGPVELGLSLVYTKRSLGFSGQTFLFTEQNFDNVSLNDQQVQLLLSVGMRFW